MLSNEFKAQTSTDDSNSLILLLKDKLRAEGKEIKTASVEDWYRAVAEITRDRLTPAWYEQQKDDRQTPKKRAYYLSMEYLMGPHTQTALHAAKLDAPMREALANLGQDPDEILRHEPDPGLGNGGLGRLAACFLDSAASLNLPLMGYGLFYRKGFFTQHIKEDGHQTELPDHWLQNGNPWGFIRDDRTYNVKFFGEYKQSGDNGEKHEWRNPIEIKGMAHDLMVPGYEGDTVNTLRLWDSVVPEGFHRNKEIDALIGNLNERLYPDDTPDAGKRLGLSEDYGKKLRLMQEYFFTSLSLQDIIARHLETHDSLDNLSETTAIQLNDTHPALAIPELMRLLVDEHKMEWKKAKDITRSVCSYTNHTLLPEALEQWSERLMDHVLPRHKGILRGLHNDLMAEVDEKLKDLPEEERNACKARVSIMHGDQIRMGHLAAFCSGRTNGVSAMHSDLVKQDQFPDLEILRGEGAAGNNTNGITPRRWLVDANRPLANLITEKTGNENWITNLSTLDGALKPLQNDPDFREQFRDIKRQNKQRLADLVAEQGGPQLNPNALFDIQVKRIHEYKRQFLNILHTVALYQDILEHPETERPDTVKILAGKAAPSYVEAKDTIALTNFLANKINNDPKVGDKLKLAFVKDYNVSKAQIITPAADLSEQISTAGKEASGTGNMKFMLNGALTIGTRDGANVEMGEKVGEDNIFFFGKTKEEIDDLHKNGYDPRKFIEQDERLLKALEFVRDETPYGYLAQQILDGDDEWKVAADFSDYWDKQEQAQALYLKEPEVWLTKSIANTRKGSHFSSDDTIKGYAEYWKIKPRAVDVAANDADIEMPPKLGTEAALTHRL